MKANTVSHNKSIFVQYDIAMKYKGGIEVKCDH